MEIAFQKTEIPCMVRAVGEVQNSEQTQELRLPDGMPDIGQVVCAWGQVILRGKEWRSDSILISGGMLMWVLYTPEGGGSPQVLDGWLPFQMRWMLPEDCGEGTIRITALTRFADARSVSPRKLMLRGGIGVMAEALVPRKAELLAPKGEPEGVELLKKSYPVRLPREAGERAFTLEEELNATSRPEKLLCYTLRPEITEQKVLANKIAFRGNANLHVAWLEEDGSVGAQDFPMPFSQVAELRGSFSPDARVDIGCCVTDLEVEVGEMGQLLTKCGLTAQYLVDDLQWLETVEDAYAPGRDLRMEKKLLEIPTVLERRVETVAADARVIPGGQIVDVSFLPDFPRQYREGGDMSLEIPGTVQTLCRDDQGNLSAASARWEGKLLWPMGEGASLMAVPQSPPTPQAFPGGEGTVFQAQLPVLLTASGGQGIPMVAELEPGQRTEPDPQRPSLILRRAGADGLWEIAKACGSTVGAIRIANGLQEEPKPGQMLLIPVI